MPDPGKCAEIASIEPVSDERLAELRGFVSQALEVGLSEPGAKTPVTDAVGGLIARLDIAEAELERKDEALRQVIAWADAPSSKVRSQLSAIRNAARAALATQEGGQTDA
jgi:hypothetical protein